MTAFDETERTAIAESLATPERVAGRATLAGTALRYRSLLLLAAAVGSVAALLLAPLAPPHTADPELSRLLAAMGLIKGVIVAGAMAVIFVRFRWPVSAGVALGYLGVVGVAAFAAAMIVQLAWVGRSALAFHAAALVAVVLAALDGRDAARARTLAGALKPDDAGSETRSLIDRLRERREA